MENVKLAFYILPNGKKATIGHQFVQCHMVFDIKMELFRHKAWLMEEGLMIKAPTIISYASVSFQRSSQNSVDD